MASPMEKNLKLRVDVGKEPKDPHVYQMFVGSLLYSTIRRCDVSFPVGAISQFI